MNIRLLTTLVTLIAISALRAQDAASPDPRIAAAQAYQAERKSVVESPFAEKLGQLNGQLDLALARDEEMAIEAGDLDLVTAIQAERKYLDENAAVSDNDENAHVKMKRYREAWRSQNAKLDSEQEAVGKALTAKFAGELQKLETTLTKERKIQDALAVRKLRESLAEGSSVAAETKDGWATILDGKSLSGWRTSTPAAFQIVERGIRAQKPSDSESGMLFYTGEDDAPDVFHSFEVRIRVHVDEAGSANSGFFFHVPIGKEDGGVEINLANSNVLKNQTGTIYDIKSVKKPLLGQKETFELIIRVTESEILVTADGREIMRHDPSTGAKKAYDPAGGAIALQSNSTGPAYVFEQIEIRNLD
ncbi:MAG: hypothetical protein ACI8UO_004579 [Verrucomicrobiales bacterium]|jgi:hypothetical protein